MTPFRFPAVLVAAGLWWVASCAHAAPPEGFVYLDEAVPEALFEVRYAGPENFVGTRVDGYEAGRAIATRQAAEALRRAALVLRPFGLGLKVFDAYRPQQAVDHFVRWAADHGDQRRKAEYYPQVDKENLFRDGYIAKRSGHSRGSTVDVTLFSLEDGSELDMGTSFDFFGPQSAPAFTGVPAQARANRALLQRVMVESGFRPLKEEWWHFTLVEEPFPGTYFDFPVR